MDLLLHLKPNAFFGSTPVVRRQERPTSALPPDDQSAGDRLDHGLSALATFYHHVGLMARW